MLDRDTVIRHPHSPDDPRISVTMQEDGAEIVLFFPPGDPVNDPHARPSTYMGEVDPVEVRLLSQPGRPFPP